METAAYCREIETYLCRKNDGHLIRVVGPSFDLVAGWAGSGVPLKVAFSGIDRCFERYYRQGPRRRPVQIDFCKADVLDAFDAWRRAVGLPAAVTEEPASDTPPPEPSSSLPAHLRRVVERLTNARATGRIDDRFDSVIDAAGRELDCSRASGAGLRGAARAALIARLAELDEDLLQHARTALDEPTRRVLLSDADAELAPFRGRMTDETYEKIRQAAYDRLLRQHLGLPVVTFR